MTYCVMTVVAFQADCSQRWERLKLLVWLPTAHEVLLNVAGSANNNSTWAIQDQLGQVSGTYTLAVLLYSSVVHGLSHRYVKHLASVGVKEW